MDTVSTNAQLRQRLARARTENKSIGLVPTMGNLHAGHMALVHAAVSQCDFVVATSFVNPLQFSPHEDLASYPRTPEQDQQALAAANCQLLYAPKTEEIYPEGIQRHSKVIVPVLTEDFCGASRPGHFDGVSTVVAKLFNLVNPDKAYFGLKDYQQFLVISKMVTDLAMDIELLGVETVRDESGLALSSRNNYLSPEQKAQAARLYQTLQATARLIESGNRNYQELEQEAAGELSSAEMMLDYLAIRDAKDLQLPAPETKNLVILGAVRIGPSRLIDNIRISIG